MEGKIIWFNSTVRTSVFYRIDRSPLDSPHKGAVTPAKKFSLMSVILDAMTLIEKSFSNTVCNVVCVYQNDDVTHDIA